MIDGWLSIDDYHKLPKQIQDLFELVEDPVRNWYLGPLWVWTLLSTQYTNPRAEHEYRTEEDTKIALLASLSAAELSALITLINSSDEWPSVVADFFYGRLKF